ncbi:MAG: DsrE/DsrF-like family protein [Methanosaeta sp. PtaU1.Bin112]|nr:MAG: DsrE/DsrF-like family protein [Methanosaeta sp. PtaU1.Bin112]
MQTLTIILTDGPYISEYAEMAYKIAVEALRISQVNVFLYLDAVHLPKAGQQPSNLANAGRLFRDLAERGAVVRACSRCAAARGYLPKEDGICPDYVQGIRITSLYDLAEMVKKSDKVVALSR